MPKMKKYRVTKINPDGSEELVTERYDMDDAYTVAHLEAKASGIQTSVSVGWLNDQDEYDDWEFMDTFEPPSEN